jgi:predicted RNase H-like nuclease (RuvC/YqgF family)
MSSHDQINQQILQIYSASDVLKYHFEQKNKQLNTLIQQKDNLSEICKKQSIRLMELEKKLSVIQRQKQNLTYTCEDQTKWIETLQTQLEQLQKNLDDPKEHLCDQQQLLLGSDEDSNNQRSIRRKRLHQQLSIFNGSCYSS